MFYTYIVISESTGKIYIGYTSNLELRIKRHNKELPVNKKGYTYKNKGPWKVIHSEMYETREDALNREKQLKSSRGRDYIKNRVLTKVR